MWRKLIFICAMVAATQASATIVTRDFELTASSFSNFLNQPAPFKSFKATFRLTYDDTLSGFQGAPVSFQAVTDGKTNFGPFSEALVFGYFPISEFTTYPRLGVGGALNGGNVMLNDTNDFYFTFDASATGPTPALFSFVTPGMLGFLANDAIVTPVQTVAPVPEPAGWALMIGGFGMIGASLRHRARRLQVS